MFADLAEILLIHTVILVTQRINVIVVTMAFILMVGVVLHVQTLANIAACAIQISAQTVLKGFIYQVLASALTVIQYLIVQQASVTKLKDVLNAKTDTLLKMVIANFAVLFLTAVHNAKIQLYAQIVIQTF